MGGVEVRSGMNAPTENPAGEVRKTTDNYRKKLPDGCRYDTVDGVICSDVEGDLKVTPEKQKELDAAQSAVKAAQAKQAEASEGVFSYINRALSGNL